MLKDLVKQCRSYRRFYQDTAIPYNELADMVDTARLAASASNAQALKFKILCTPEECADIFPYIAWAGALKDWDGPEEGERPSEDPGRGNLRCQPWHTPYQGDRGRTPGAQGLLPAGKAA